ncbi:MAG: NAD(P)H-dependent oxidoreductase [Pseudomonadota bacterium]
MTTVLYLNASPRGDESAAAQAAQIFLRTLSSDITVQQLNLFDSLLPDYTHALTGAKHKSMVGADLTHEEAAEWEHVTALVDQFLQADHILMAIPMWNFGIPYKFKQYVDLITHPGITFLMDKTGPRGVGSASGTVIYSRGGDYSPKDGQPDPFDFQSPYLKAWSSLVGISPLEEVLVQGTMGGPDAQAAAVNAAGSQLESAARALT